MNKSTICILIALVLLVGASAIGQPTNPAPQSLPYSQNWGTTTFASMPTGTAAWQYSSKTQAGVDTASPTLNRAVVAATASQTTAGPYGYMPGTSGNARLYIQSSTNTTYGACQLVTAVNTGTATGLSISYTIEAVNVGTGRGIGVVLQYRAGTSGSWTTVSGSAVTYNNSSSNGGSSDVAGNIDSYAFEVSGLTTSTDYQIRWATWNNTTSGNSPGVAFDDISISKLGGTITTNTTAFVGAFGAVKPGNSSASSSFTVAGTNLTDNIVVTAPTGFEMRTGVDAFSTNPISLTPSEGTVSTTTIDVRSTPLSYGKFSGNVSCTSTDAVTRNIFVSAFGAIKSVANGNWSSGTTWDGSVVPTTTDNVYVDAAYPVTIDDGSALCKTIDFDPVGTSGLLIMGSASSVLSVYGDFNLGNSTQMVFAAWPAGAKIVFAGSAAVQTLNGFNASTTNSGGFMEMQVNKSAGKLTTSTSNMKLTIGTSLEIINGTFELGSADDIFGRDQSGNATTPTITVQSGGVFTMMGSLSQINAGTSSSGGSIGLMTIFGQAEMTTTSTAKIRFGGINVENGGVLRMLTGWDPGNLFVPGTLTIKNGGTLRFSSTASAIFDAASPVILESGGYINVTISTAATLPGNFTDNGGTFRYSTSAAQAGILSRTYTNLELSGAGIKTLGGVVTVNGTLSMLGTANLDLGGGSLTYGPSAVLQYGASGQTSADTTTNAEWPAAGGPPNVRIYNGGGVTLHESRTVTGAVTMTNGTLSTGANTLTLGPSATLTGEQAGRYVIGTVTATQAIGTGASSFVGIGVTIDGNGEDDLGNATVTRVSGAGAATTVGSNQSIARKWSIVSDNPPAGGTSMTFTWNSSDDNGKVFSSGNRAQLWKYDGVSSWNAVGTPADVSGSDPRSVSVMTTSFSDWSVSDEASPLPVEMTSLNVSLRGPSTVVLSWKTASEANNSGFEMERRSDGTNTWRSVGFVDGAGTSNIAREYSWQDRNLAPGLYAYRIKQIDKDGTFHYSASVQIDAGRANGFELLENYPNPFNPSTEIRFAVAEDGPATLRVYNTLGQQVALLFDGTAKAGHFIPVTFNAASMPSGVYFMRLEQGRQSTVKRLLLTK